MNKKEKSLKTSGYAVFLSMAILISLLVVSESSYDYYEDDSYNYNYDIESSYNTESSYSSNSFDEPEMPDDAEVRGLSSNAKGASASIFNPRSNSNLKNIFSSHDFTVESNLSFMWWEFDRDPWEFEFIITEHEVQDERLQNQHGVYTQTRFGSTPVVYLVRSDVLYDLETNNIATTSDGYSYFVNTNKLIDFMRDSRDFSIMSPSPLYSGAGMGFVETIVAAKAKTVEFTKEDVANNSVIIAETIKDSVKSGLLEADVFQGVVSGEVSVGVLPESFILEKALAGNLGDYEDLTILYPDLPIWLDFSLYIMSTKANEGDKTRVWELGWEVEDISWNQMGIRQGKVSEVVSPIKRQLGVKEELPTSSQWSRSGVNDYILQILEEVSK